MTPPDTFERVFTVLDPVSFESTFRAWIGRVIPAVGQENVIAIEGYTSRHKMSKVAATLLHLVSACPSDVGAVLG